MARRTPRHAARSKLPFPALLLGLLVVAGAVTSWQVWGSASGIARGRPTHRRQLRSRPHRRASRPSLRHRPLAFAERRADPRPDQHGVPRDHDVPGERHAGLLRRGTGSEAPGDPLELSGERGALLDVCGRRRIARLVRNRLDRATERHRARGRLDRDPRGRLRRALSLPERSNGTAGSARTWSPATSRREARPRTRRVSAVLRGLARQPVPHRRDGPPEPHGAVVHERRDHRLATRCGTTTGTERRSSSATTSWRVGRTAGSTS